MVREDAFQAQMPTTSAVLSTAKATAARADLLRQPRRIVRRYIMLAMLWLASTDLLLAYLLPLDRNQRWLFALIKGALFILASAQLLHWLQDRALQRYLRAQDAADRLLREQAEWFDQLAAPALRVRERDGHIVAANQAAQQLLDYSLTQLCERRFADLVADESYDWQRSDSSGTLLLRRHDGVAIPMRWSATRQSGTQVPMLLLSGSELTGQNHAEDLQRMLSDVDNATGLPSRNWLAKRIETCIAGGTRARFALLMLDLDHFRGINELHGHAYGDRVLRAVATRLRGLTDDLTQLARFGGDEFIILGGAADTRERALALGEFAMTAVAGVADPSTRGHCSIGIALYPDHGRDAESLFSAADLALGQAKRSGRNQICMFDPELRRSEQRQNRLHEMLRAALAYGGGGLYLRVQPQHRLDDGRPSGMEALLRWRADDGSEIPVVELIEAAERSDQMDALGLWVLRKALQHLVRWRQMGAYDGPLAVNVSPTQLHDDAFVDHVRELLREYDVPAQQLELEITETVAMHVGSGVRRRINALAELGVRIAIDDFGTGYSSLAHFKHLQVHKLKIDVLFVRNVHRAADSQAIVRAMLGMASALGLTVVAEGVEQPDEAHWLRDHGCTAVQGYLYAPPLREDELIQHLASCELRAIGDQTLIGATPRLL